jgi:hypothetical protein
MRSTLVSFLNDWSPPILLRNAIFLYNRLAFLSYAEKTILQKNITLKNAALRKRAFLLATGPSVRQEDLKALAGEDCYSVSNFFLHEDINLISPQIHFFAPYHEPLILKNYVEWLQQADMMLPNTTRICLGHSTRQIVQEFNLFPDREIYYLYLANVGYRNLKAIDLTRPVLAPYTGPLMILPVLLYMGYKVIYLIGCDHTVLRDYKRTIKNFYRPSADVRKNATDVNAWDGIIDSHLHSLSVLNQYNVYKKLLDNISIVNLSQDSWLDIFEVDTLDRVMSKR